MHKHLKSWRSLVALGSVAAATVAILLLVPSAGSHAGAARRPGSAAHSVQHPTAAPHTADSTLPSNCAPNSPSAAACAAGQQQASHMASTAFPSSPPPGQSDLTQDQAISDAEQGTATASSLSAPPTAQLTTYGDAASMLGESATPAISPSLSVWIVSLSGAINTVGVPLPPGVSPQPATSFTVILDAANGNWIDKCYDCSVSGTASAKKK
jgi:hypothetical protein